MVEKRWRSSLQSRKAFLNSFNPRSWKTVSNHLRWFGKIMIVPIQSSMEPSISTISHHHASVIFLSLCPPQSLFLILPFFWPPRPKPDFLTSPSHCLFLVRRFFMPPLCRNCCFCFFLRSFRIWLLVFSSERTVRPPGVFCSPAGLWKLGPCWPRPRPRPRPGKDRWHANKD